MTDLKKSQDALGNYEKSKLYHGSIKTKPLRSGRGRSPGPCWETTSFSVWSPTRKYFSRSRLGIKASALFPCPDTLKLITEPIELNEREEQNLSHLAKDIYKPPTLTTLAIICGSKLHSKYGAQH